MLSIIAASCVFSMSLANPRCQSPNLNSFVIGSYNQNPFRSFRGRGLTIISQTERVLTKLRTIPTTITGNNPSYVAIGSNSQLYVSNSAFPGGTVTRLRRASPFNQSSAGVPNSTRASHVSVSKHGVVFISNTFGGTVMSFDAATLQRLDTFMAPSRWATQTVPRRQDKPAPHMVYLITDDRRVVVPDLGTDRVYFLTYERNRSASNFGKMWLVQSVPLDKGDGPRHVVQHKPSGNLFVVNELSQTLTTLCRNSTRYAKCQNSTQIHNRGAVKNGLAAAVRISRTGKFLYASLRRDTKEKRRGGIISGFMVSKSGHILSKIGQWRSGGVHPRDFDIVYDLKVRGNCRNYIAVANRDSNNVVFFRLLVNGTVIPKKELSIRIGSPSSILQFVNSSKLAT